MFFKKKEKNVYENWDEYSQYLKVSEAYSEFPDEERTEDNAAFVACRKEFELWTERKETWHKLYNDQLSAEKRERVWPGVLASIGTAAAAIIGPVWAATKREQIIEKGYLDTNNELSDMGKNATRNAFNASNKH